MRALQTSRTLLAALLVGLWGATASAATYRLKGGGQTTKWGNAPLWYDAANWQLKSGDGFVAATDYPRAGDDVIVDKTTSGYISAATDTDQFRTTEPLHGVVFDRGAIVHQGRLALAAGGDGLLFNTSATWYAGFDIVGSGEGWVTVTAGQTFGNQQGVKVSDGPATLVKKGAGTFISANQGAASYQPAVTRIEAGGVEINCNHLMDGQELVFDGNGTRLGLRRNHNGSTGTYTTPHNIELRGGCLRETSRVTDATHEIYSNACGVENDDVFFVRLTGAPKLTAQRFTGRLVGRAGLEFAPDVSGCSFAFARGISTSAGAVKVSNGTLAFVEGASAVGLSALQVGAAGVLVIPEGSGVDFRAARVAVAADARLELGAGVRIACDGLTIGASTCPTGTYTATTCPQIVGDGCISVGRTLRLDVPSGTVTLAAALAEVGYTVADLDGGDLREQAILKSGAGTLALGAELPGFTGCWDVLEGTVSCSETPKTFGPAACEVWVRKGAQVRLPNVRNLNAGRVFHIAGAGPDGTGALSQYAFASAGTYGYDAPGVFGTVKLSGDATVGAGHFVQFGSPFLNGHTLTFTRGETTGGHAGIVRFTGPVSGAGRIVLRDGGIARVPNSGANLTLTDTTAGNGFTVCGGQWRFMGGGIVGAGASVWDVDFCGPGATALFADTDVGRIDVAAANNFPGPVRIGAAGVTVTGQGDHTYHNLKFQGPLSGSGPIDASAFRLSLYLELSNPSNTYSGAIRLGAAVLRVGAPGALPKAASVLLNATNAPAYREGDMPGIVFADGTYDLGALTLSGDRPVRLGGGRGGRWESVAARRTGAVAWDSAVGARALTFGPCSLRVGSDAARFDSIDSADGTLDLNGHAQTVTTLAGLLTVIDSSAEEGTAAFTLNGTYVLDGGTLKPTMLDARVPFVAGPAMKVRFEGRLRNGTFELVRSSQPIDLGGRTLESLVELPPGDRTALGFGDGNRSIVLTSRLEDEILLDVGTAGTGTLAVAVAAANRKYGTNYEVSDLDGGALKDVRVVKRGSGLLALDEPLPGFHGTFVVERGVVLANCSGALGAAGNTVVVRKGAQVRMALGATNAGRTFRIAGEGPDGQGALVGPSEFVGYGANHYFGNRIELDDDAKVSAGEWYRVAQSAVAPGGHVFTVANVGGSGNPTKYMRDVEGGGVLRFAGSSWRTEGTVQLPDATPGNRFVFENGGLRFWASTFAGAGRDVWTYAFDGGNKGELYCDDGNGTVLHRETGLNTLQASVSVSTNTRVVVRTQGNTASGKLFLRGVLSGGGFLDGAKLNEPSFVHFLNASNAFSGTNAVESGVAYVYAPGSFPKAATMLVRTTSPKAHVVGSRTTLCNHYGVDFLSPEPYDLGTLVVTGTETGRIQGGTGRWEKIDKSGTGTLAYNSALGANRLFVRAGTFRLPLHGRPGLSEGVTDFATEAEALAALAGTACAETYVMRGPLSANACYAENYTPAKKTRLITYRGVLWNRRERGPFGFRNASNGSVRILVDGAQVVDTASGTNENSVLLEPGPHVFEYRGVNNGPRTEGEGLLMRYGDEPYALCEDPGDGSLFTCETDVSLPAFDEVDVAEKARLDLNGHSRTVSRLSGVGLVESSKDGTVPTLSVTGVFAADGATMDNGGMFISYVPISFGNAGRVVVSNVASLLRSEQVVIQMAEGCAIDFGGRDPAACVDVDSPSWTGALKTDSAGRQRLVLVPSAAPAQLGGLALMLRCVPLPTPAAPSQVLGQAIPTGGIVFTVPATNDTFWIDVAWQNEVSANTVPYAMHVVGDGKDHDYSFDGTDLYSFETYHPHLVVDGAGWRGNITSFTVKDSRTKRVLPVRNLRFTMAAPETPAYLYPTVPKAPLELYRAGVPFTVDAGLFNGGTLPARGIACAVSGLPAGVALVDSAKARTVGDLSGRGSRLHRVALLADRECAFTVTLTFSGEGFETVSADIPVKVGPSLGLPQVPEGGYIPEPTPVACADGVEVGAFLFNQFGSPFDWMRIWRNCPERRAAAGWYTCARGELLDWQIKWAVENGISFYILDWYSHGDNFFRSLKESRFKDFIRWELMWCNHTDPGTCSEARWRTVVTQWITEYFPTNRLNAASGAIMTNYRLKNGKPVVCVWSGTNLERDNGSGGCKRMLDLARQMARVAGLEGIWFQGIISDGDSEAEGRYLKALGFDEVVTYHYLNVDSGKARTFANIVSHSKTYFETKQTVGGVPQLLNVSTGWNDRPWNGSTEIVKTVAEFRTLCEHAKASGAKEFCLAPLNEWGEGSYAEPNYEFGFGFFEAVRDTFCVRPEGGWPVNYTPGDVGLKPVDVDGMDDPVTNTIYGTGSAGPRLYP